MFIDPSEMQTYLLDARVKGKSISKIVLALINEAQERPENLVEALKIWNEMQTQQAAEHTISILRSLGRKDLVSKYSKWVFGVCADVGLRLFTEGPRGKSSIDDSSFRPNP